MVLAVQILGAFIILMGLVLFVAPGKLVGLITTMFEGNSGFIVAVGFRLLIGALLLATASQSRFTLAFQIIGGIAVLAALVGLFMGKERIKGMVDWWIAKPPAFTRLWSLVAIAFGAFIYYGYA